MLVRLYFYVPSTPFVSSRKVDINVQDNDNSTLTTSYGFIRFVKFAGRRSYHRRRGERGVSIVIDIGAEVSISVSVAKED